MMRWSSQDDAREVRYYLIGTSVPRYILGFALIVNDFLGVFRDSNSQLFGDYSIYLLGINDYLDDYLGKKSDY